MLPNQIKNYTSYSHSFSVCPIILISWYVPYVVNLTMHIIFSLTSVQMEYTCIWRGCGAFLIRLARSISPSGLLFTNNTGLLMWHVSVNSRHTYTVVGQETAHWNSHISMEQPARWGQTALKLLCVWMEMKELVYEGGATFWRCRPVFVCICGTCQVYQRICDDLVIMRPLLSCTDAKTEIFVTLNWFEWEGTLDSTPFIITTISPTWTYDAC